jgi:ketosteroid isomerase-like protein
MVLGVHATMPRPVPVPPVAVLRSLLGIGAALLAGGLLVFVVVGAVPWAVAAGAFACGCGVVVGLAQHARLAIALALAAIGSLAMAFVAAPDERGAEPAVPARTATHVPPPEREGPEPARPVAPRHRAERLVTSYYAALDAGDFERAWARLAPGVQQAFGGFDTWRAGYATTLGHDVKQLEVEGDTVTHVLVASDRTPCGGRTERRFAVAWRLQNGQVATLSATKLGGVDPSAAC